jgi:hypothetical protein
VFFVDEDVAGLKSGDFALVIVDTDDIMSDLRKADDRNQANVTRANNRDLDNFAHDDSGG